MTDLNQLGEQARRAARVLAVASTEHKNAALNALVRQLHDRAEEVLASNAADVQRGRELGLSEVLLDRSQLTKDRLAALAAEVEQIVALPDPVGEVYEPEIRSNGLRVHKCRVPFGVVGLIYEARPTVTVEAAALCLKSGNAAILRGGSESRQSNAMLTTLIQDSLLAADLPADSVQAIDDPNRALVLQLIRLDQYIDVIIPRGSATLNHFCRQHATIPVISGGSGVCHIYVDRSIAPEQVVPIVRDAKVRQPTACNALETLLVHRAVAPQVLPAVAADLLAQRIELRVDEEALRLLQNAELHDERIVPARASDFGTEFVALILAVRIVDGIDTAIDHIARYGTGHSEAILTNDQAAADRFVRYVDAAGVFVNASLRFHDADQLGFGTEIAISNQKLHARGPMALRELTSYKRVIIGQGHVRG